MNRLFGLALISALGALTFNAQAAARPGKVLSVGSGLAYPTLGHSLIVNPTAIVDAPKLSLQGGYMLDPKNVQTSLIGGGSTVGFGGGFRQSGAGSIEEFGFAGRMNVMTLGATLRTYEFENLSGDVALNFDFSSVRLTVIGRDFADGFDRLDAGFGFMSGPFSFGLDVKKSLSEGNDTWLFDAGLAVSNGRISAGVGHTFSYLQEFQSGNLHAGVSIEVMKSFAVEGFYRPSHQEWASGEWVVGARITL